MKHFYTLLLALVGLLVGMPVQAATTSQLIQLKNAREGNYLYESGGKLTHRANVQTQNASKWILRPVGTTGNTFELISYATGKYVQAPTKNVQVALGNTSTSFIKITANSNVTFLCNGQYLNASPNNENVLGWDAADEGSQWVITSQQDITDAEVESIMGAVSSGYVNPSASGYYRLYNQTRNNYMSEDFGAMNVNGTARSMGDFKQVWKLEASGSNFRIKNALTDHQLKTPSSSWSARLTMVTGTGSTYNISKNSKITGGTSYFQIKDTGTNLLAHMDAQGRLVNWWDEGSTSPTGNEWLFEPLTSAEIAMLDAARAEFSQSTDILNNVTLYQAHLNNLFADMQCTQLKSGITASNLTSNSSYLALPAQLQRVVMKVAQNSWASYEKDFRVASYQVYSDHDNMPAVIGNGYKWGQLSNPTGIYTQGNEIIMVFVGSEYDQIPRSGSTPMANLKLEYVPSSVSQRNVTGTQVELKKGLNIFLIPEEAQFYIFYEIRGAGTTSNYYLSKYPDIPIHIEGGTVDGYFDTTRGMTDSDWLKMRQAGLLNYQRLQLKSKNVLVNWPGSYVVAANITGPSSFLSYWDNVARLENELMGLYMEDERTETYFPGKSVHLRFRNIFNVTGGGTDGSMYASSYGAYFGGAFNDLASASKLHGSGGTLWAPGHELGHCHQKTINMQGMGEVSNNLFSNVVLYELCLSTSRGDGMNLMPDQFARRHHWLEYAWDTENIHSASSSNATHGRYDNSNMLHIGWWVHTQMYYKLYEFFHMAGRDPNFYPKLFAALRATPLTHGTNQAVPASADYLRFAEKCCEVSGMNLSPFFEMFGFFRMPEESDYYSASHYHTIGGQSKCLYLDDYGAYYVYVTQAMIDATKRKMAQYGEPVSSVAFIDDRFSGAKNAKGETQTAYSGEFPFGSMGAVGCSVANFTARTKASAYAATTTRLANGGVSVRMTGMGAAGFIVRDQQGNMIYFSSFTSFTIPAEVINRITGDVVITIATTEGRELPLGVSEESVGIEQTTTTPAARAENVIYDLQGRRVITPTRGGIYIINGKKRVY